MQSLCWYQEWGEKLLTISKLAPNRGWKQRRSRFALVSPQQTFLLLLLELCSENGVGTEYYLEVLFYWSHSTEIIAGFFLLERHKAVATREKMGVLSLRFVFKDSMTYCYVKAALIFVCGLLKCLQRHFWALVVKVSFLTMGLLFLAVWKPLEVSTYPQGIAGWP